MLPLSPPQQEYQPSPSLPHSPPVVAQETSSLLLEEGLPGAQRTGDGGQRGHGREVRWARTESVAQKKVSSASHHTGKPR